MTETSELSLPSALLQSVEPGFTYSALGSVSPSQAFNCQRKEVGWVGGERKMGGGREERKAKSVGRGEAALSYPGGSVSQCSYILGG